MDRSGNSPETAALPGRWRRPLPDRLLLLVVVLLASLAVWLVRMSGLAVGGGEPLVGLQTIALDTRRASWGFNLEPALVDPDRIRPSAGPRESIPALVAPDAVPDPQEDSYDLPQTEAWVAGVVVNGEARAYPESLLRTHECINDELGGEPIAVVYHWPGEVLAAFSRTIEGVTLEFGVSGLLLDGTVLLLDRHTDPHDESLWSPVQLRAVTGPAAGAEKTLQAIDVVRTTWVEWKATHPASTIASLRTGFQSDYRPSSMVEYLEAGRLPFPVTGRLDRRMRPGDARRMVVVRVGDTDRAYAFDDLRDEEVTDELGGTRYHLAVRSHRDTEQIDLEWLAGAKPPTRRYMLGFVHDLLLRDQQ